MLKTTIKLTLGLLLTISLIFGCIFLWKIYSELKRPMIKAGEEPLVIEIKPNSTAFSLISYLYDKHFIHSKSILLNFIKFHGLANQLKAGYYRIMPGDSVEGLLDKIVAGAVMSSTFRIIEGSNIYQVSKSLEEAPLLKYNSSDWDVISSPQQNKEGLLLADSYFYLAGSDAKLLLTLSNKYLLRYLNEAWQNRDKLLPYKKSYDLLIVASILEKESAIIEERKIISGIIINRLAKNMLLQMDPTVIYSLGQNFSGKLTHADLAVDSPYNTYRYRGLPPTPISMVGKSSIDAAAHPKHSKFLYFVAKGDGTHIFSETYSEQREAISRSKGQ